MIKIITFVIFFVAGSINLFAQTDKIMTYSTVSIPITGMKFVYTEQYGSASQSYDYSDAINYVLGFGYNSKKVAVLFLNSFRANNISQPKNLPQDLTVKWLENYYGKPALNNKVKVLVGVVVPPQVDIIPSKKFKILTLKNVNILAFQSLSNDPKASKPPYSMPHRIFDRLVMMNFVDINKKYSYSFEIHDMKEKVYTFIALPSSITPLLNLNNNNLKK